MDIERHPSRDREHLESQIASGHEVLVNGRIFNRTNVKQLPTQEELDGEAPKPATLAGRQRNTQATAEKVAAERAAEKAAAEKAEAERAAAEKEAADKAAAEKLAAEKTAANKPK